MSALIDLRPKTMRLLEKRLQLRARAEEIRNEITQIDQEQVELVRSVRQELSALVDRGGELAHINRVVETAKACGEDLLRSWEYREAVQGSPDVLRESAEQREEVRAFVEWVHHLETLFSKPTPPFDPSRIPAAGSSSITIAEARERFRAIRTQ